MLGAEQDRGKNRRVKNGTPIDGQRGPPTGLVITTLTPTSRAIEKLLSQLAVETMIVKKYYHYNNVMAYKNDINNCKLCI